jgi:hypothetical protein
MCSQHPHLLGYHVIHSLQLARHVTSRAKQELQARQEKNRIAKVVAQKVHAQLAEQQFFF